jgi:general stress protein 26
MDTTLPNRTQGTTTPFDATLAQSPATHDRQKVHDLLKEFSNVMFVTQAGPDPTSSGSLRLRARPMGIAHLEEDCTLWFFTSVDSSKVEEARASTLAHVVCQSAMRFLSVEGRAAIVHDRATIERFWTKAVEAWFPNGKDDPQVCLIRFVPAEVEYWDSTGTRGLKLLFETARALVTGESPRADLAQHDTMTLNGGSRS